MLCSLGVSELAKYLLLGYGQFRARPFGVKVNLITLLFGPKNYFYITFLIILIFFSKWVGRLKQISPLLYGLNWRIG